MPDEFAYVEMRVGPQGRVVIPASLRQAWPLEIGDVLLARLEGERLILERPAHLIRRAKDRFAGLRDQPSLADELIAERRHEAAQEERP